MNTVKTRRWSILTSVYIGSEVLKQITSMGVIGSVHSVFNTAANIITKKGQLIGIITQDAHPCSITIKPTYKPLSQIISQGQTVFKANNNLIIEDAGIAIYMAAPPYSGSIIEAARFFEPTTLLANVKKALPLVYEKNKRSGILISWLLGNKPWLGDISEEVSDYMTVFKSLEMGVVNNNRELIQSSVGELCGRGYGLTPSGDDMLAGLIATMLFARNKYRDNLVLGMLSSSIGSCKELTNVFGWALLEGARQGVVAKSFADVLWALNGKKALIPAVKGLLSCGATSGADTLCGIVLALRIVAIRMGYCGKIQLGGSAL